MLREPALEQVRRRPGILARREGPSRRWAIRVVKRSSCISTGTPAQALRKPLGERARLARLVGVRRRQAPAEAPPRPARPRARRPAPQRAHAALGRRVGDLLDRRDDRARRVADRAPAAGAAVVQRQYPHASAGPSARGRLPNGWLTTPRPRSRRGRRRSPPRASRDHGRRPGPSCPVRRRRRPRPGAAALTSSPGLQAPLHQRRRDARDQVHAPVERRCRARSPRRRACPSGGRPRRAAPSASGTSTAAVSTGAPPASPALRGQPVDVERPGPVPLPPSFSAFSRRLRSFTSARRPRGHPPGRARSSAPTSASRRS